MSYETLIHKKSRDGVIVTFNRRRQRNSINTVFLEELREILGKAEKNPDCRYIVFKGRDGYFCSGMDFSEIGRVPVYDKEKTSAETNALYMETVSQLTLTSKIIISIVEGNAMGGGMGFIAASDIVFATPNARFSLPEALWGLLPSMVVPYLIRRIGWQNAYRLSLTTMPVSAAKALEMNLADEITKDPERSIRNLWQRMGCIQESTIINIKQYFRKMWIITEKTEQAAVQETSRLMSNQLVRANIYNYLNFKMYPWEKAVSDKVSESESLLM